jgi:Tfp pilus assembly protein PilX
MNLHSPENRRNPNPLENEKGFALVTVLVLSAVLMATMAIVLNSSTMETIMSGASAVSKRALACADAGVEYVRGTFVLVGGSFPSSSSTGNYTDMAKGTVASAAGALPNPLNNEITFLNLSSMGVNNSLLTGRGFSSRFVSSSSGGGGMRLSAYQSRITSRGVVSLYGKSLDFEGFSLAP